MGTAGPARLTVHHHGAGPTHADPTGETIGQGRRQVRRARELGPQLVSHLGTGWLLYWSGEIYYRLSLKIIIVFLSKKFTEILFVLLPDLVWSGLFHKHFYSVNSFIH